MELVYCWIYQSKNGFIENQGFNFYGEHFFNLEVDGNNYILSYESRNTVGSKIFKDSGVQNVTAIVGENGSGKSTIFYEIQKLNFRKENDTSNVEYGEHKSYQNKQHYNITVYINEQNKFVVYDNLPKDALVVDMDENILDHHYSVNRLLSEDFEKFRNVFQEYNNIQTKIYLSNSSYLLPQNSYSIKLGQMTECNLTANSLSTIAKSFYQRMCFHSSRMMLTDFILLNNIIESSFKLQNFQEICDILYYAKLKEKGLEKEYLSKLCSELDISIELTSSVVEKNENYHGRYIFPEEIVKKIEGKIVSVPKEIAKNSNFNNPTFINRLYKNLIYELIWVYDIDLDIAQTYDNLPEIINDFFDVKASDAEGLQCDAGDENVKKMKYYKEALIEIAAIENTLNVLPVIPNLVPPGDIAYKQGVRLSLQDNEDVYWDFCKLIEKFAKSPNSFVLKYLRIEGLHMSSGERALQNMLSWLNLIPVFNEIVEQDIEPLGENVLLLIDEIDLYMHPKWQRKLLNYFINELKMQFSDKNIQIILSTHSPFVLSDLPKENIIYLKPNDGNFDIEDYATKTFGTNIHTLLKSSFFMSSTIGEFAKNKIKYVSDKLDKQIELERNLSTQEYNDIKGIIDLIGERIVQNILNQKLSLVASKQLKINELKKQLESLEHEVGDLDD